MIKCYQNQRERNNHAMKLLRILAILLVTATLLPMTAFAYGSGDGTLLITHINTSPSTEGSAIIRFYNERADESL